ncbi:unnamed protein product [Caenorhabditis nigoni]
MGSVKWIMFNFHFWCMFLDYGVTILAVPFMIFPALAGFPLGILREINCPMEVQAYLILTLLAVVSAAIITIFENRYYIVFAQDSNWRRYRIFLSILNYTASFTWCLPSFLTVPEQTMARKIAIGVSTYMTIIQLPIIYYLTSVVVKYHNQAANNIGFIIFSFNGVCSTIVMILIHKPYRDFCMKIMRMDRNNKITVPATSYDTATTVAPVL